MVLLVAIAAATTREPQIFGNSLFPTWPSRLLNERTNGRLHPLPDVSHRQDAGPYPPHAPPNYRNSPSTPGRLRTAVCGAQARTPSSTSRQAVGSGSTRPCSGVSMRLSISLLCLPPSSPLLSLSPRSVPFSVHLLYEAHGSASRTSHVRTSCSTRTRTSSPVHYSSYLSLPYITSWYTQCSSPVVE